MLDTNTCIGHLTGRAPQVTEQLRRHSVNKIVLCSVVKAALLTGAQESHRAAETLALVEEFASSFVSHPFDDQAAEQYALIRASLESAGTPIGPNDLLIAAIALARQCAVVTSNIRGFRRIYGLVVEDWSKPGA